jgi:hypothetical protein
LYGFIGSQLGDVQSILTLEDGSQVPAAQWIRDYFDIRHSFIGVSAAILIGFVCTFAAVMAFSLRYLNFQKR